MSVVGEVVAAVRRGDVVLIPTDTVYGIGCTPYRPEPVRRLSDLKGRSADQPIALVAGSVDWLLECIPELRGTAAVAARALLPGALTLVLPNPARRFPWLTGARPDTIGVRVPSVLGVAHEVLEAVGVVAATSANLHGGPDPRALAEVPAKILDGVAAFVHAGELPGAPSTVLDLTGEAPVVLREGAVPASDALARVRAAVAE